MKTELRPRIIVTHDDKPVAVVETENDAFAYVQEHQSSSVHHATTYEGWAWKVAEPWPSEAEEGDPHGYKTAGFVARSAWQCMSSHDHGWTFTDAEDKELVKSNCGACVLGGYEPPDGWEPGTKGATRHQGPNCAGWARIYVEARHAIPCKWAKAFEQERKSDNVAYAAALERSIATFGGYIK